MTFILSVCSIKYSSIIFYCLHIFMLFIYGISNVNIIIVNSYCPVLLTVFKVSFCFLKEFTK